MSFFNPSDYNNDGKTDFVDYQIYTHYIDPQSGEYQGNPYNNLPKPRYRQKSTTSFGEIMLASLLAGIPLFLMFLGGPFILLGPILCFATFIGICVYWAKRGQEKKQKSEEEKIKAQKRKKLLTKVLIVLLIIGVVSTAAYFSYTKLYIPLVKYNDAKNMLANGNYDQAITSFKGLNGFLDSTKKLEQIRETQYQNAKGLINSGEYDKAYNILKTLTGYKDVNNIIQTNSNIHNIYLSSFKIKNTVRFGNYEQDNFRKEKEPIEWIVLDRDGDNALLISKYIIDCKPFDTNSRPRTWENSSLRNWLNSTFLEAAFNQDEQKLIQTANVSAAGNPRVSYRKSQSTSDRIFILSDEEVNNYFISKSSKICKPTAYAESQGADAAFENDSCLWWLRNPGENEYAVMVIGYAGDDFDSGIGASREDTGVRPAMWIKIK